MENFKEYIDDLRTNTDTQLDVELESLNRVITENLTEQKELIDWIKLYKNKISEINELELTDKQVIDSLEAYANNISEDIKSLETNLKRRRKFDFKKLAVIQEQNRREDK